MLYFLGFWTPKLIGITRKRKEETILKATTITTSGVQMSTQCVHAHVYMCTHALNNQCNDSSV